MSAQRKYFVDMDNAIKDAERRKFLVGVVSKPAKMAQGYFFFTDTVEGVQAEPGEGAR